MSSSHQSLHPRTQEKIVARLLRTLRTDPHFLLAGAYARTQDQHQAYPRPVHPLPIPIAVPQFPPKAPSRNKIAAFGRPRSPHLPPPTSFSLPATGLTPRHQDTKPIPDSAALLLSTLTATRTCALCPAYQTSFLRSELNKNNSQPIANLEFMHSTTCARLPHRVACPPPPPFVFCPFSPFIRPPSADGRTARRAPARNFSTSRAASARKSRKIAGSYPPKPPKIRTSGASGENSYIHFRTSFLQSGCCEIYA